MYDDLQFYLDCAMCGAAESFVISKQNPSKGYCFAEQLEWEIASVDDARRRGRELAKTMRPHRVTLGDCPDA